MAHPAVAVLESALRARKLDRTLTSALPPLDRPDAAACTPTNVAALDACLRGGLPRGELSEVTGPASSGRTTLVLQMLSAATGRGEIVALVDTLDRLDVASAVSAGVACDRLLWIRGQSIAGGRAAAPGGAGAISMECALDRAIKALSLVLQAGGFGLVALDLADVPARTTKQLPLTTWMRLQRMVEGSDTACVLLADEPVARSAGGLTLSLAGRPLWRGLSDRSRRLAGTDIRAAVRSPRRRVDGTVTIEALAGDARGAGDGALKMHGE